MRSVVDESRRVIGVRLPTNATLSLSHGSVLLLEPITQALGSLHVLVYASHDAAFFPRGERLALKAVDAVVEALLDKVGIHLASGLGSCETAKGIIGNIVRS